MSDGDAVVAGLILVVALVIGPLVVFSLVTFLRDRY